MPRTKEQFENMRRESRKKILSAAIRLFADKGMAATSIQEIAELAGVSTGLIYRYYKSKQDMYDIIVNGALRDLKKIAGIFESDESPKLLMEQVFTELRSELVNDIGFSNVLVLMTQAFLSENDDERSSLLLNEDLSIISAIENLIARGQQTGDFAEGNPREMAMLAFSSIQGLGIMKTLLKDKFSAPPASMILAFLTPNASGKQ